MSDTTTPSSDLYYSSDGTIYDAAGTQVGVYTTDVQGDLTSMAADLDRDGYVDTEGYDTDGDAAIDTVYVDTDDDGYADTMVVDTDGDGQADTVDHHSVV